MSAEQGILKPFYFYWKNILHLYDISLEELRNSINGKLQDELRDNLEWVRETLKKSETQSQVNFTEKASKFRDQLERLKKTSKQTKTKENNKMKKQDYCSYRVLVVLREFRNLMGEKYCFSNIDKPKMEEFLSLIEVHNIEDSDIINNKCYERNVFQAKRGPKKEAVELVREAFFLEIAIREPKLQLKTVSFAEVIDKYGWKKLIFTDLTEKKECIFDFSNGKDEQRIEAILRELANKRKKRNKEDEAQLLFSVFYELVDIFTKENHYICRKNRSAIAVDDSDSIDFEYNEYDSIISSHILYFLKWIRVVPEEEIPDGVLQIIEGRMISKSRSYFQVWIKSVPILEREQRFVKCKEARNSLLLQRDFERVRHIVLDVVNNNESFGSIMQDYFDQVKIS